jgi:hypothetical protein
LANGTGSFDRQLPGTERGLRLNGIVFAGGVRGAAARDLISAVLNFEKILSYQFYW